MATIEHCHLLISGIAQFGLYSLLDTLRLGRIPGLKVTPDLPLRYTNAENIDEFVAKHRDVGFWLSVAPWGGMTKPMDLYFGKPAKSFCGGMEMTYVEAIHREMIVHAEMAVDVIRSQGGTMDKWVLAMFVDEDDFSCLTVAGYAGNDKPSTGQSGHFSTGGPLGLT